VSPPARRLGPELRGVLLTLLAMGLFGAMDGISKLLVAEYPATLVLWLRHLVAVPVAFLILAPRRPLRLLRSARPGLQAARAALLVVEMNLVLLAFRAMPLAEAHAILAVTPLLVTALSAPLLGERVGWRRWLAVAVGFVGVLVILRPGLDLLRPGAVPAVAATLLYAAYNIVTRKIAAVDRAETTFLLQTAIGALLLSLVGPFFWVTPAPAHWPLILVQGTLGALGHLCLVRALTLAPAVVVQPFTYTLLVYAAVIGFLVFGDVPDTPTVVGGGIVVAAGVYAALRTHKRAAERPAAAAGQARSYEMNSKSEPSGSRK
jgi:drug/metabolite transporter (DMT)-like permease